MPYAPEGSPFTAQLVFIGEAPGANEMRVGRPLVGPSGHVFDQQLDHSGILRKNCYITNLFDFIVQKGKDGSISDQGGNKLWAPRTGFSAIGQVYADALIEEVKKCKANVLVPMGNPALEALTGKRGIFKWRGSILWSDKAQKKVVPTIHPANALHGTYINRYIIRRDFVRAIRESTFPEVIPPDYNFTLSPTFQECLSWLDSFLVNKPPLSVDVEVAQRQVSRCCYALNERDVISIPYGDGGWTLEQECILWKKTAQVLEHPEIPKLFQNGLFDCWMFFHVHDILVQGHIDDLMIAHHILYPDFSKGLAFMTSLYTDQPFYKDMVKHGDVDKSDG